MPMKQFRKHQKYILAVLAVALMVVWGMGSAFRNRGGGADAEIGEILGETITVGEYRAEGGQLQMVDPGLRSAQDKSSTPLLIWRTMILARLAERDGIRVTDEEVRRELERRFGDRDGYAQELARFNLELDRDDLRYEMPLRRYMLATKYHGLMASSVPVTRAEVRQAFLHQLDEAEAAFVTVPVALFKAEAIGADEATLRAFYEKRAAQGAYATPEQMRVRYIQSSYEAFMDEATKKVNEAEVKRFYEQHKDTRFQAKTLDEVRDDLLKERREALAREWARDRIYEVDEAISSKKDADWAAVAAAKGLTVRESKPFHRQSKDEDVGIVGAAGFAATAFETRDEEQKRPEGERETVWMAESEKGLFLYRIIETIPPASVPFDKIAKKVDTDYVAYRSQELAHSFMKTFREAVAEKGWDKAVAETEQKHSWFTANKVTVRRPMPTQYGLFAEVEGLEGNQGMLAYAIFRVEEGAASQPIPDGTKTDRFHIATRKSLKHLTEDEAYARMAKKQAVTEVEYVAFGAAAEEAPLDEDTEASDADGKKRAAEARKAAEAFLALAKTESFGEALKKTKDVETQEGRFFGDNESDPLARACTALEKEGDLTGVVEDSNAQVFYVGRVTKKEPFSRMAFDMQIRMQGSYYRQRKQQLAARTWTERLFNENPLFPLQTKKESVPE